MTRLMIPVDPLTIAEYSQAGCPSGAYIPKNTIPDRKWNTMYLTKTAIVEKIMMFVSVGFLLANPANPSAINANG